jgi:YbbR domain-containing protein
MDVTVQLSGEERLTAAFEVQDTPTATPEQLMVVGAESAISRIATISAEAVITEDNALESNRVRVVALDEDGRIVEGVTFQPQEVQVTVAIGQRENSRLVGIRVQTEGELPSGYRISRIVTIPSRLILLGSAANQEGQGNFVSTIPVDVSQIVGDLSLEVPLETSSDLQIVSEEGEAVVAVQVQIEVVPRQGSIELSRQIEILNETNDVFTMDLSTIELVLSGPIPILEEITLNPDLVRVFIDAADLEGLSPGQTMAIAPSIVLPDEISAQFIPGTIQVTLSQ